MNGPFIAAQVIEFFHVAFLQVLQARLDQARYVLKGGANLRYFFESLRYSEDMDLDAVDLEPWKLEQKVDEVLASPALQILLRSGDLVIAHVTKPKQTPTTQRWKPFISDRGRQVRTKIEFSHRGADERRILEAIPDRIVSPYALRSPTVLHYTAAAAIEQKLRALAQRSETQARDVFDLELLFRRHRDATRPGHVEPRILEVAMERALGLPFEAFRDQVVPFLDPDVIDLYDEPSGWDRIQAFVAERIGELHETD